MKTSWIKTDSNSDFSIYNIPFGIYGDATIKHCACSAIGDYIIDLVELAKLGYLNNLVKPEIFESKYLNDFISLGKSTTNKVRERIMDLFSEENKELQSNAAHQQLILKKQSDVCMLLPIQIGDYTDFYSSIDHATNIGKMIRDPENALMPN